MCGDVLYILLSLSLEIVRGVFKRAPRRKRFVNVISTPIPLNWRGSGCVYITHTNSNLNFENHLEFYTKILLNIIINLVYRLVRVYVY